MKKSFKIAVTGGGSGGHVMPALSVIKRLKRYSQEKDIDFSIIYIGSKNGIEKDLVLKNNIDYFEISTGKLRRYISAKNFTDIFRISKGLFDSLKIFKNAKPDLLFSTGGFVSVPPVIAANLKKIPIIIHEQTVDAGLANKIASRFANFVALTFEESKKYFPQKKVILTGIPLRDEIFEGEKDKAYLKFNLTKELPTIYFTGGGLGCHILNQAAMVIIPDLLDKCNVVFQTGNANDGKDYKELLELKESLSADKKKGKFILYNFITEDLPDILAVTDLAIARSGAGTVNEFMALKIPAIFIPLAIATKQEQLKNAMIDVKAGGAEIVEEKDLTPIVLLKKIEDILFSKKIKKMKENLSKIKINNGTDNIIGIIEKILGINI
ncbi:MAG TPA: undecaprenyldiphospho-muramoylpentapeptide beta-N-acetylglucosaminyltransferase [Spirochaetota bacterium]|mgnify:CR=1 FL=1|nr:undecaprenyldiphospho-muramoylpentapeptide beta-N-acetylglucosaminyltransferase [Spirochaetota bacterium]HOL57521.1 undecaprenyldiphospho-muramoylpentapeptide beta-N-acetylglucosaminyltransferase [Spirochaetota bacterium]HPP05004.1 undecaprenyldiphospho-muramoylpentapeptide beta-N-acetylglucosaminyltransferase [Spirochaetota bacterium]